MSRLISNSLPDCGGIPEKKKLKVDLEKTNRV